MHDKFGYFDWSAEARRRRIGEACFNCYVADWERRSGRLSGKFGNMLMTEIQDVIAEGPSNDSGYGIKHLHIINNLDTSWHVQHRMVDQLCMIHRKKFELDGSLNGYPEWEIVRRNSNIDVVLPQKLSYVISQGSCGVRPQILGGGDVSVQVIPSCNITVIPDENNSLRPIVVIEYRKNSIYVWDISNPDIPVFGEWSNITAWKSGRTDSQSVKQIMSGDEYPWYYNDNPVIPWTFYKRAESLDILPVDRNIVQDTIDIILQRSHIQWISYVGSMSRPVVLSDESVEGVEEALIDASIMLNLHGGGSKSVTILPSAMDDVRKLWDIHSERVMDILNRYDLGLQVKKSEAAKSGIALELELSGLWQFRSAQEQMNATLDEETIRNLLISHNYVYGDSLPVDGFSIRYPISWTASEKKELLDKISSDIALGIKTPVDYYIAENDLPDNPQTRYRVMEILEGRGQERARLAKAGLLVDVSTLTTQTETQTESAS